MNTNDDKALFADVEQDDEHKTVPVMPMPPIWLIVVFILFGMALYYGAIYKPF